ncbi:leucine rich repeat / protein phosphatase 2C domain containing protein [Entamoeba histolytica HM-1:IMSS-B]|uniref:Leucine rich repeat / protein phosphatase 2C domain containing protein n=6 Tax=Entamoeba histolytica TaxID=5759 RepID=C4LTU5_ENTH1|nr:leucine rich repeat / protein phosphatase 2C domain containing protein [Entamoeba histolytica HM-1:IMSS]EMD48997.1 protein phosphatase, putative [Entamoeba histolytica KU27]EMH74963.1 leucine rich repeat / protein phosphatase 2C domain containing protein [Entamoeba histolytica HM-1:IMSS-B]EMS12434.1 protein phosphatase 2C, putative [Entamoeba histolytica HM-3:IMSS]ENY65097.1 protein phosphatase 2C, putative [Entamoeba histolytica HM-1:IMSS-A]GAT92004.1 leucine rich repeat protein phosphatas|eukprot:XP_656585.1 leucine rich repeat / protein phosphatase 2C domain containing protein [Entamoeba histolytica HM-1:IMSS]
MSKVNLRGKRLSNIPSNIPRDVSFLDISLNKLDRVPSDLSSMTNLTKVSISFNKFTSLTSLYKLKSLVNVENNLNPISVIDKGLSKLTNLKVLVCNKNTINTIQEGTFAPELTTISLEMNFITTIPISFGLMHHLKQITFAGNCLMSFPVALTNISSLSSLNLNDNVIKVIPESITNMCSLVKLMMNDNELTIIPMELFTMPSLQSIQFNKNRITSLPDIPFLKECHLEELILNNNHIGSITSSITNLSSLRNFECENNNISTLPCLTTLTALTQLNLSNNSFSTIVSLPPNLKSLYLPFNELVELCLPLPSTLTELLLDNNKLLSPPLLSTLSNLRSLNLSANQISSFPNEITILTALTALNLTSNCLSLLPEVNTEHLHVQKFNASFNHFITLPNSLLSMTSLTSLELTDNNLLIIPSNFTVLIHLRYLSLSSNNLTTFPIQICNFSKLQALIISNNNLYELPSQLTSLSTLTTLDLSFNHLNSIDVVTHLIHLQCLDVSSNDLVLLPEGLTKLSSLIFLNLSENKIISVNKLLLKPSLFLNLTNNQITSIGDIDEDQFVLTNFDCNPFKQHHTTEEGRNLSKTNSSLFKITVAHAEMTGLRPTYEDSLELVPNFMDKKGRSFTAVYDGHSGQICPNYVAKRFHCVIEICLNEGLAPVNALKEGFNRMQEEIVQKGIEDGCTAVVVMILDMKMYVAWAGDSRAVLCRGGKAIQLSEDHKPNGTCERERIIRMGGHVFAGRVNGELAISRSFGDIQNSPIVSAVPEIREYDIMANDEFVIVACDGVWDVVSNQKAVDIIKTSKSLSIGSVRLRDFAYSMGSQDNITCAVVTVPFCY